MIDSFVFRIVKGKEEVGWTNADLVDKVQFFFIITLSEIVNWFLHL